MQPVREGYPDFCIKGPITDATALRDLIPDRFQIGDVAALGEWGAVYKADDRLEGKPVLVKSSLRPIWPGSVCALAARE